MGSEMCIRDSVCTELFFLFGRLVSISRFIKVVSDFVFYVFKSRINYGFFYASVLGKVCAS